jgi:hypothetical protein
VYFIRVCYNSIEGILQMAINFPGEWEVRINYTAIAGGVTYEHQHRLSIKMDSVGTPGDPFSDWVTLQRNLATRTLDAWLVDYIGVADYQFRTDTDFTTAELWRYPAESFNADFYSVETIGLSGSSALATVEDAQTVYSFRTTTGGVAKADWRHTVFNLATFESYPFVIADKNTYVEFLADATSPVIGRDNGYVFAPLKFLPGTNEDLTKGRLR